MSGLILLLLLPTIALGMAMVGPSDRAQNADSAF